eukprot:5199915-Alexandrium_andersonii.AAC.1
MSATRNWPSSPCQHVALTRASLSALASTATPPPLPLPARGAGWATTATQPDGRRTGPWARPKGPSPSPQGR